MDFSTYINDKKIDLYFYENGRKISDFCLTSEEARRLAHLLLQADVFCNMRLQKGLALMGKPR